MALDTINAASSMILSTDDNESSIPRVYFDKIILDKPIPTSSEQGEIPYELFVKLQFHLEIPLESGLFTSNDDFLEGLSVVVFRTHDPEVANTLQIGGWPALETHKSMGSDLYKSIDYIYNGSLMNLSKGTDLVRFDTDPILQTTSGKNFIMVDFQIEDKNMDPNSESNLFYYAYCYFDLASFASTLGIYSQMPSSNLNGPISGESVIVNGKVNTTSFVYLVTLAGETNPPELRGTYWTGPVIEKNGQYEAARYMHKWEETYATRLDAGYSEDYDLVPTFPRLILEKIQVRNSKIQDFRIVNQLSSLGIDLDPAKFNPITIKGRDTFNNSFNPPDAYTSGAFLSRDMHNNCRFMFEFDYEKFITQESKFGRMLTNPFLPETTRLKIYAYSRITNLEIIRRQVETLRSTNKLLSPILGINQSDLNKEIAIIARTASEGAANLLPSKKLFSPGLPSVPNGVPLGSVQELPSIKNSPKETRTIMATDNSVRYLTDGSYQYGVRIDIEDGTVRFLNERLKNLKVIRNYLVEYYNILSIPKKSWSELVQDSRGYYNKIFDDYEKFSNHPAGTSDNIYSAHLQGGTFDNDQELNSAAGNYNAYLTIVNLRYEANIATGPFDDSGIILYPWVVAPEYYIDTMESISDFSTEERKKVVDLIVSNEAVYGPISNPSISSTGKTPGTGGLESIYNEGRGIHTVLGRAKAAIQHAVKKPGTSGAPLRELQNQVRADLSARGELGPSGKMPGLNPGLGARMSATGIGPAIGKYISENLNVERTKFIDLFDEKAAKYSLSTLLDPATATPESVTVVISMFDALEQRIRFMMGASAEINAPPPSTRQVGVSKSSKVLILNLEDYFPETFDAQLSQMPYGDRIGFVGSSGYIPPVTPPPEEGGTEFADGSKIKAFSGPSGEQKPLDNVSGPLGLTGQEWLSRLKDEKLLYQEEGMSFLTGQRMTDLTPDSAESKKIKIQQKLDKMQKNRESERKLMRDRSNQSGKTPVSQNANPGKKNTYLSLAVINDRSGEVIERPSNLNKAWDIQKYSQMKNKMAAMATGDFVSIPGKTTNQDAINHMMNKMGVSVMSGKLPMNAAIGLKHGSQTKAEAYRAIGDILGNSDAQAGAQKRGVDNSCIDGGAGDGSENLKMCKNESAAQPAAESLINEVVRSGAFNQVAKKTSGNPTTAAKIFNSSQSGKLPFMKGGTSLPVQVSTFQDMVKDGNLDGHGASGLFAARKFVIEDLARVQIFAGYQRSLVPEHKEAGDLQSGLDDSTFTSRKNNSVPFKGIKGNILIKKPMFEDVSDSEWYQIISDLEKDSTPYASILCRFVDEDFSEDDHTGLSVVYTNTYFLIDQNEASRFQLPTQSQPNTVFPPSFFKVGGGDGSKKPSISGPSTRVDFGPSGGIRATLPSGMIEKFGSPLGAQQSITVGSSSKNVPPLGGSK
jgi:hypothetical protein